MPLGKEQVYQIIPEKDNQILYAIIVLKKNHSTYCCETVCCCELQGKYGQKFNSRFTFALLCQTECGTLYSSILKSNDADVAFKKASG